MREIRECMHDSRVLEISTDDDLRGWLTAQARTYNLPWLLAHAEDGVIWGKLRQDDQRGEVLALSCEAYPNRVLGLRWETLQQARLFGEAGELLVWPGPLDQDGRTTWQARLIRDDEGGPATEYIDEDQLLWGDHPTAASSQVEGFVQIAEGSQGIVHAPPIGASALTPNKFVVTERTRLRVRHYYRTKH